MMKQVKKKELEGYDHIMANGCQFIIKTRSSRNSKNAPSKAVNRNFRYQEKSMGFPLTLIKRRIYYRDAKCLVHYCES